MSTAKRFRLQAARCADLAKQTHDEESRQRYLRLERTYLQMAETEDRLADQRGAFAGASETKPAA